MRSWFRSSIDLLGLRLAFQLRQWQSGFLIVGLAGVASPPKAVYRLSLSEIILASLDLTNAGLAIGWAGDLPWGTIDLLQ